MIKFFRHIRQKLISEGKTRKYFQYAIGEILLVMIGILLAIQVNNWNETYKNRKTEEKLLVELRENLLNNITKLKDDIRKENQCIESINLVVDHLNKRKPYHDSLDFHFKRGFFSPDIVLSTSGYEAIKSKGFEIINNDELRKSIINLYDVNYDNLLSETIRIEDQFWPVGVLPMVHKHFRFLDSRCAKPVDYTALLNDQKYVNMILHRKHFRKQAHDLKTESLHQTELLLKKIEVEFEKNKGHD